MKILALETSCERASVALLVGAQVLEHPLTGSGAAHSSHILPAIRALLAEAELCVADCDVIAFGAGPGSFTGVRLACGIAQGLALGADKPVAPISSLLALASPVQSAFIYCAMDARMGEAYVALYQRTANGLIELNAPVCVPPAHAPVPDPLLGQCRGVGTAFTAYEQALQARLNGVIASIDAFLVPTASAVAYLAQDQSKWCDPALAAPLYVRNQVALTIAERLAQGGKA